MNTFETLAWTYVGHRLLADIANMSCGRGPESGKPCHLYAVRPTIRAETVQTQRPDPAEAGCAASWQLPSCCTREGAPLRPLQLDSTSRTDGEPRDLPRSTPYSDSGDSDRVFLTPIWKLSHPLNPFPANI